MTIFNICLYKLNEFISLFMQCLHSALFTNERGLMCCLKFLRSVQISI